MRAGAAGKNTLAKGSRETESLFVKPLGQCRLAILSLRQTVCQRKMLEKAGIMHVKPGD